MVTSALERLIRGGSGGGGLGSQPTTATGSAVLTAGASGASGAAVASQRRLRQEQEAGVEGGASPIDAPLPLEACDWLNVTACNTTGDTLLGARCR